MAVATDSAAAAAAALLLHWPRADPPRRAVPRRAVHDRLVVGWPDQNLQKSGYNA